MPFGQHQDTELWNNQFPETKILGLPVSQRMRGLVYLESRGEVDVNTFHKDIQYALERLGKSKFGYVEGYEVSVWPCLLNEHYCLNVKVMEPIFI